MIHRIALFALLLLISWTVMLVTHECGHLIGGLVGGATLTEVDLAPWRMPYSLHAPDPLPLVTLWAGPILGVAIPVLIAAVCRRFWVWFIADFCMLANGAYLALAWISGDRFLDTPRLLAAGAPAVMIVIYCVFTIGFGYRWFRSDCARCLWSVPEDPTCSNGGDCVPRGDGR